MKQEYKSLLIALLAILLVNAIGSLASRQFNFNYLYVGPVSFLVYFALGYAVTQRTNLLKGTLMTGVLGLFDATAGWKVSMVLNANVGNLNNHPSSRQWITTVIAVTLYGLIVGLIGGGIAKGLTKKRRSVQSTNLP